MCEIIAKAGKPFTEGEFVKKCMLQAPRIVCPEKKGQFNNIIHSGNTVAERISDLSSDICDPEWLMDLAFFVDITYELNILNKKLQGQGQIVSAAYEKVRAFCTKLMLWKTQLSQTSLCHFPACKALVDAGTPFSGEKYLEAILKLHEEFNQKSADFKTHRATFQIFANPFSFDEQDAPPPCTSNGAH